MKVSECMSRDVRTVTPDTAIQEAARLMLEADAGALPVGTADQVQGMITDRDIAVRAVALGRGPDTPVREAMSAGDLVTCHPDQDIDDVAVLMSDHQVRRIPVLADDGRLLGMISLADLARSNDSSTAEAALHGASRPGGAHDQSENGVSGQAM